MVYCEASVHTFRHRIESWSHCLHICANIFIALSQIKRGNKFNARTHFKLFPISWGGREELCSILIHITFQVLLQTIYLYFPSQHTIHQIYHTSGRDGMALREQSFPPFLDGRAWVGSGCSANSHWLPLARWFWWDWGSFCGWWLVDSGGFNWRPEMRSHIRTINFGYYYSSKGKVGRSNANKWFYERILFAIIWSMVFLRLRINTGRGAGGGGGVRSCCSSNKTVGRSLIIGSWYQRWIHLLWYGAGQMDGDWKTGACAPVASRLLLFQTQNWIRALGTIDSQTKCTRGKEALLQDSPPGDIIIIITLRLLKTVRKPAGIWAMINCFAFGDGEGGVGVVVGDCVGAQNGMRV